MRSASMPASASALTPARVAASDGSMSPSQSRRSFTPATSCSTLVLMPRRSIVGLSRAWISSEVNRRGASMWARPAMATCWNNMAGNRLRDKARQINALSTWMHRPPVSRSRAGGPNAPFRRVWRPRPRATPHEQATGCLPGQWLCAAAIGREALLAVVRLVQRLQGVGLQARAFIARQGFQFLAHAQRVAFVEADLALDRDGHFPALHAARRGGAG